MCSHSCSTRRQQGPGVRAPTPPTGKGAMVIHSHLHPRRSTGCTGAAFNSQDLAHS